MPEGDNRARTTGTATSGDAGADSATLQTVAAAPLSAAPRASTMDPSVPVSAGEHAPAPPPVAGSSEPGADNAEPPMTENATTVAASEAPDPVEESADVGATTTEPRADVLEEISLPALVQAPDPLPPDTIVDPAGRVRIGPFLGARGRINHYQATWTADDGQPVPIELRESFADQSELGREAAVLGSLTYAMVPRLYASFSMGERQYLASQFVDGETLEAALAAGLAPERAISIVLQLVQLTRQLQRAGWALVGLAPSDVRLGEPICLARLASAVRIGARVEQPFQVAGYSAPELAQNTTVTGKEDVYTLGAILYRALSGQSIADTGVELSQLPTLVPIPGAPQLLAAALAPISQRVDLEEFYTQLVAFKRRQSHVALGLEVASATTLGLNPGRLVNEDAAGYLTWSESGPDGIVYRGLLCVADGMGGMEAGEVASTTALAVILGGAAGRSDAVQAVSPGGEPSPWSASPNAALRELVERAAQAVYRAADGRQVGTTVTCVAVNGGKLTLAHVGDTRAYLARAGVLTQLTADHTLVAALVTSGVISKDEARGHPDSNKVLRSLGSQRELPDRYIDSLEAAYGQPSLQLQPDDWIVICTDGVWGQVDDQQIQATLAHAATPAAAASALIDGAIQAEAPDNATAIVARGVALRDR